MLFVPGNNWRMIKKIPELPADAIILDLEDSVPILEKEKGRFFVKESLEFVKSRVAEEVYVRVNATTTGLLPEDLEVTVHEGLDGIMLPKCESAEDVLESEKLIEKIEKDRGLEHGSIGILPTVETAAGVENAFEIATASKRVFAIGFGAGDYMIDMGGNPYVLALSKDCAEILYPRSRVSIAARAAKILALDTVFFGLLTDIEGLIRDSQRARNLGFKGKFLIHPSQIEPVNKVFSPSVAEVEYAKGVKQAFEEAEQRGLGAATFQGRMIDVATYRMAKGILTTADIIAKREERNKRLLESISETS